jgi:RNA polymerase sigma factor (sigma-70 family)
MAAETGTSTPLERLLRREGVEPGQFYAAVLQAADNLGMIPISERHAVRIRHGRASPSGRTIYLLVAATRIATSKPVRAAEIFLLEPPLPPWMRRQRMTAPLLAGGSFWGLVIFCGSRVFLRWYEQMENEDSSAGESLERLYREHLPLLRAIAICRYRISRDDADALVNDLFVSFLERQPRVQDARAYLTAAMRNLCLLYWRARRAEVPLEAQHHEIASQEDEAEWTVRIAVGAALARIGPRCREMLRAYYLRGDRKEEIAVAIDRTPGYVMQMLVGCRRHAREILTRFRRRP